MSATSTRTGYSIAAVSKLTGVSCHALRVWERRYGFPAPERSPSGHRRYGNDQVEVLRHLSKQVRTGQSIGELIRDYRAGTPQVRDQPAAPVPEKPACSTVVDLLFAGDMGGADELMDRLANPSSPLESVERIIEPAMVEVGERWFRGEAQVFQERCATSCLLGRLTRMIEQARRSNPRPSRTVLIGSVQGDHHSGGVLMVSLALELAGWRAVPLGVDVPIEEYQKAVETWRPDALALSFVLSRNINKRFRELSKIRGVPVFVGGRSIVNHQALARRHGLIPLVGTLRESTDQLVEDLGRLARHEGRPGESAG